MRKVNELIIRGDPVEVTRIADRIESAPENGWKRDRSVEGKFLPHSKPKPYPTTPSTFCFMTPIGPGLPQARLLLWKMYGGLQVTNILPVGPNLTEEEYNLILDRFKAEFLDLVVDGLDVDVRIEPFRVKMETILSPMAWKKLDVFSRSSDRKTIDVDDRRNWLNFVNQVHLDNAAIDSEELGWWLDNSGWPEEQRRQLVESYEESLSMLRDYDEARFERAS